LKVLQRVIVEQCSTQTKAVIQAEGVKAVGEAFQQLGQSAGEDIVKDPAVKQQLQPVPVFGPTDLFARALHY
jgi:hypothetical protein